MDRGPKLSRAIRVVVASVVSMLALIAFALPAFAHEGEKSMKSSDLVRQAIALIVNMPGDRSAVEDKINDALASSKPEGVDLTLVAQAKTALAAGEIHRVRALLEIAIGARPHTGAHMPLPIRRAPVAPGADVGNFNLATGDSPGPGIAGDPLIARRHFDGKTTVVFIVAALLAAMGVVLAIRYRPVGRPRLDGVES